MRTADLIPLILLELNECDKYGFELTKSIETKSKGNIIIKQPTLYTILKKLEKSKFISSYWQDSDIGGKRHYYKITDNGRLQVATLPSYDRLIENILHESGEDQISFRDNLEDLQTFSTEKSDEKVYKNQAKADVYSSVSIMDSIIDDTPQTSEIPEVQNNISLTPQESILSTSEVFGANSIDNATELEINQSNTQILKNEKTNTEENFAENKDISKFTKKESTKLSEEYRSQFTSNTPVDNAGQSTNNFNESKSIENISPNFENDNRYINNEPYKKIKYVDYVDFKTNSNYIYARNVVKNIKNKIFATSLYLFIIMIISAIVSTIQGKSEPIYYVFFLLALAVLIFYPSVFANKYEKLRLKLQNKKYEPDLKKRLYISLAIELTIIIICIIVNMNIGNNTIRMMLEISNFANFYAPILISTVMFADIIFTYIFIKKSNQ